MEAAEPSARASQPTGTQAIWRVAVPLPLAEALDYLPPEGWDGRTEPGVRVRVPVGRGERVGVLLEIGADTAQPLARLKSVTAILDSEPLLGAVDLALLRWAAAYYHAPLGTVLFAGLPTRLRTGRASQPSVVDQAAVRLTAAGSALAPASLSRAPRQQALLTDLRAAPEGLALAALQTGGGSASATLRALEAKGLIERCRLPLAPPSGARHPHAGDPNLDPDGPAAAAPTLNPAQSAAVTAVREGLGRFRTWLLEGVTGSGKTEVYIRLLQTLEAEGGQTLLLVPEIGLTPQLVERLARRLSGPVAVLHSGLGPGARERIWQRAAAGQLGALVGTRSAVFVPLPRLRLIVVDEEHDPSLKQQEGFRYSARDVAVRRGQLADCPVILGSATPSLESLHNVRTGRYAPLHLPERAGAAREPILSLLDIRDQPLRAGLSPVLRESMRETLEAGNQVLLFLNRRGYAPILTCHGCGWIGGCPHCDARLTLHLRLSRLWCHHCGWFQPQPTSCPDCQGLDLRTLGRGTERLEEELPALFPGTRIARIDRDSIRRKGDLDRLLGEIRSGAIRILLGTQMLAKGHHFPGVTLVGILELDQALYAADFRAPERTAQLIIQVSGRAGRAERPGRVVLQTRHPEHPLLQSLLQQGYPGFARAALREREAAQWPPFAYLALIRAEAAESVPALDFLRQARHLADACLEPDILLLGPVPAPMERRAGRSRAQLLVQGRDRPRLHAFLRAWITALRALPRPAGLRWSLDVDPQELQ